MGDLELTWQYPLSEFHSKQARVLLWKSISYFAMGLNGSPYGYVILAALIAILCASIITSFQPPLSLSLHIFTVELPPSENVWKCGHIMFQQQYQKPVLGTLYYKGQNVDFKGCSLQRGSTILYVDCTRCQRHCISNTALVTSRYSAYYTLWSTHATYHSYFWDCLLMYTSLAFSWEMANWSWNQSTISSMQPHLPHHYL